MRTSTKLTKGMLCVALLASGAFPIGAQTFQQRGADIVGTATNNNLGTATALSAGGNTLVVSEPFNQPGGTFRRGTVRVYDWNAGTSSWVQRGADIDGFDGALSALGSALDISADGNTIVLASNLNNSQGSLRILDWNAGTTSWVQRGSAILGESADDGFGSYVSMSDNGNVVAAGALGNDGNGNSAGHARVFAWDGSAWVQRGSDLDGEAADDNFGRVSLSADGNTLAVGSHRNMAGFGGLSGFRGHVRVFVWNGTSWNQRGSDVDGLAGMAFFGSTVAIAADGNSFFAGAPGIKVGGVDVGRVYHYTWNSGTSTWSLTNSITGTVDEEFGGKALAVSADKNIVLVGGRYNDDNGNDRGAVKVYRLNGSTYGQVGSTIYGSNNDDLFGESIAMSASGSVIAAGAPKYETTGSNRGLVRVYNSSCLFGTVVWDGGGSDDKFSTPGNWVGDLCPCRGVKLVFNSTGSNTKNCEVDSSITHSSITLNRGYRGRLIVNDTCKLTLDSLITNAPMVVFSVGAKKSDIGVINISNNGVVNCAANAGINVTRLNLGLAGFISFRSKSSIDIGTLWMDEYSQFKGPQDGNIYLTGNLTIANRTTFDAANGKFHFTGTTDQNVDVFGANQLNTTVIVVNKASGAVVLQRNLSSGNLTLTSGNINTGSNTITLTSDRGVFGGSSSSYINGKVALNNSSAWAGSKLRIPLGQGSKYRPITLHNTSSSNTWAVEFVNSDPNTLGSAAAPLDAISADGYWTANRTAGGGGLLADATYFEISDAGKGSWNNSDLRVARLATTWNDLGGSYLSSSVISTNTGLNTNDNFSIALGVDNATPAPISVIDREDVSGNEIATSKSVKNDAVQQQQTLGFAVYPNPVSETLFFALNGADKGSVVLSDMSGKILGVYNVAETRSINMRNLSAGVYFATFTNGVNRITNRVVRD